MGKKKKRESFFFRKDEEGRKVFYPWGYPGEGFYVNQRQINLIIISSCFLALLIIMGPSKGMFADFPNIITNILECLFAATQTIFPILYIAGMHLLSKDTRLYVLQKEIRPPKKRMALLWFSIVILQLTAVLIAPEELYRTFIALSAVSILLTTYFFMKIRRTRGYYFSEKAKS
ncbi:MAG: hypothetical protein ABW127_00155 [Candidatus Thiodiazotropha endolucinida]